jgi:hypothetical protein
MFADGYTNPIQIQMIQQNEIRNIGQIEEIGEELGVELQKVRYYEKVCGECHLIHGGNCY